MPLRSRRSSSASKSPSNSSTQQPKKKFTCVWPGCEKAFSRSEHLHRHALNHKDGNNTCPRCAAHFRRRDLLDRHMLRHKEKDDAAGGVGLGILATRKRLWRDSNGNIVNARRPSPRQYPSNSASPNKKRTQSQMTTDSVSSTESVTDERKASSAGSFDVDDMGAGSVPPSPPTSVHSSSTGPSLRSANDGLSRNATSDTIYHQNSWQSLPDHLNSTSASPNELANDPFDFLCNASWGAPQPISLLSDYDAFGNAISTNGVGGGSGLDTNSLPYDDIFKPDTGMYWSSDSPMSSSSSSPSFSSSTAFHLHTHAYLPEHQLPAAAAVGVKFPEEFDLVYGSMMTVR